MVYFLGNSPHRNAIPTELLGEEILMELNQCEDVILGSCIDEVHHIIQVRDIEPILSWLYTLPHHTQPNCVDTVVFEALHHCLIELCKIIGFFFHDHVHPMKYQFPSTAVIDFVVAYREVRLPIHQKQDS